MPYIHKEQINGKGFLVVHAGYVEDLDCKFYNIDCGCAYREKCETAKLACIRLEDEKIFYV